MKENTNGQAVQGKPADQAIKGNDSATANPKNVVMTPEKIKAPIESKENEQIRDVKKNQGNEESKESKTPVAEQKDNVVDKNVPKKDINAPEQVKTPVENKSNRQVEGAEIADDEDRDDDEVSEEQESSETERKKGMPISFDH